MKVNTRVGLQLVFVVALLSACSKPAPGIVFREGMVLFDGHTLRLGAPTDEWREQLGEGEELDNGRNVSWPKHRLLAHVERSACGEDRIAGVRVALLDDDPPIIPGGFHRPVQLEDCRFDAGDTLTGGGIDCGPCDLIVGRPFDWAYGCYSLGVTLTATIRPDRRADLINYGLDDDNRMRLGLSLGRKEDPIFVASGACDRDRRPLFGDEAREQARRDLWGLAVGLWDALGNGTGWW